MTDRETMREKLVELLEEICEKYSPCGMDTVADQLIANGVTIRETGRWIGLEYDGYADGFPVYDLWGCSECGYECKDTPDYCPNCGAMMDEEDSDER